MKPASSLRVGEGSARGPGSARGSVPVRDLEHGDGLAEGGLAAAQVPRKALLQAAEAEALP